MAGRVARLRWSGGQPGCGGQAGSRRSGDRGQPGGIPRSGGRARTSNIRLQRPAFCRLNYPGMARSTGAACRGSRRALRLPEAPPPPGRSDAWRRGTDPSGAAISAARQPAGAARRGDHDRSPARSRRTWLPGSWFPSQRVRSATSPGPLGSVWSMHSSRNTLRPPSYWAIRPPEPSPSASVPVASSPRSRSRSGAGLRGVNVVTPENQLDDDLVRDPPDQAGHEAAGDSQVGLRVRGLADRDVGATLSSISC